MYRIWACLQAWLVDASGFSEDLAMFQRLKKVPELDERDMGGSIVMGVPLKNAGWFICWNILLYYG